VSTTIEALEQVQDVAQAIGSDYIQQEIVRMRSAIESDPALAIGTAKEFVETACKTVLMQEAKSLKIGCTSEDPLCSETISNGWPRQEQKSSTPTAPERG
jgi:hypothetical protein